MGKKSYGGMITREQFCFYETRTVARLITEGLSEEKIISSILSDNLFQYPTEKNIKSIAKACYKRLMCLEDKDLVNIVASEYGEAARQVCLYAMMKCYPIVWDFMTQVIGEKYRTYDMSFSQIDVNAFFMRIQNENDEVAAWTDATITKLKQVLRKLLIENGYLDDTKSDHLNLVLINSQLESAIRANGDTDALLAFNCLY